MISKFVFLILKKKSLLLSLIKIKMVKNSIVDDSLVMKETILLSTFLTDVLKMTNGLYMDFKTK